MEKLKNTKILGVIGNILIIVAMFCKWVTVESISTGISKSEQFFNGTDGKWAVLLSIISLIIIFSENISAKFFKGLTNIKLTYIPTVIQLLMVVNVIYYKTTISNSDINAHFGLGFYMMCIGIILLLLFPIFYKQKHVES